MSWSDVVQFRKRLRRFLTRSACGLRSRSELGLRPSLSTHELGGRRVLFRPFAPAPGRRSALRASLGFFMGYLLGGWTRGAAAPLEVRISLREILPFARPRSRAVGTF